MVATNFCGTPRSAQLSVVVSSANKISADVTSAPVRQTGVPITATPLAR
jgi:hypothetical protein